MEGLEHLSVYFRILKNKNTLFPDCYGIKYTLYKVLHTWYLYIVIVGRIVWWGIESKERERERDLWKEEERECCCWYSKMDRKRSNRNISLPEKKVMIFVLVKSFGKNLVRFESNPRIFIYHSNTVVYNEKKSYFCNEAKKSRKNIIYTQKWKTSIWKNFFLYTFCYNTNNYYCYYYQILIMNQTKNHLFVTSKLEWIYSVSVFISTHIN